MGEDCKNFYDVGSNCLGSNRMAARFERLPRALRCVDQLWDRSVLGDVGLASFAIK